MGSLMVNRLCEKKPGKYTHVKAGMQLGVQRGLSKSKKISSKSIYNLSFQNLKIQKAIKLSLFIYCTQWSK